MRVLMFSKACITGEYQSKLEYIARFPDIALTTVVPPSWQDERGEIRLERTHLAGYELVVTPIRLNGNFHLHYYPRSGEIIGRVRPQIIHIDEEPYNLATFHILLLARRIVPQARVLFFTWQNLRRTYPFPFARMERFAYTHTQRAIAGSEAAARVLQAKGYTRPVNVIPQFGVDENTFARSPNSPSSAGITIGFVGRLVEEKGAAILLQALAGLKGDWQTRILGNGPQLAFLKKLACELELAGRVRFESWVPSSEMPGFFNQVDIFVLPSQSKPNWIEQFGRVLIEAMACEVPVIGSTCGEIPNVIGDAGLIFPEGDVPGLRERLQLLMNDAQLRRQLGQRGRARVLAHFTQSQIAQATVRVYRELLNEGQPPREEN